ncbi:MAG: hypothetical protein AUI50_08455 [Crenarchaeota archaeon 13_1_40CM_2_52_14]|nr:MAG: hypothetical protein AUI97_00455 [Crenarchaeota archaeon 13_1_40CM_3_52_17]OLD33971.1 MAG: hypothetical protein AUI50_08455 [Crenarchaeota archaeon 13_1_40CM_2_52_14]OLE71244.1 MAG: hypothetical protein AUF78_02840 [archaeon 13_1_20CM_2_51_12]
MPSKLFLRTARFALASKPRPRPEAGDSQGISARQPENISKRGVLHRTPRDARVVDGELLHTLFHEAAFLSLC